MKGIRKHTKKEDDDDEFYLDAEDSRFSRDASIQEDVDARMKEELG